jgi:hypothetical protein
VIVYRLEHFLRVDQEVGHLPNCHLKVHLRELEQPVRSLVSECLEGLRRIRSPLEESWHPHLRPSSVRPKRAAIVLTRARYSRTAHELGRVETQAGIDGFVDVELARSTPGHKVSPMEFDSIKGREVRNQKDRSVNQAARRLRFRYDWLPAVIGTTRDHVPVNRVSLRSSHAIEGLLGQL